MLKVIQNNLLEHFVDENNESLDLRMIQLLKSEIVDIYLQSLKRIIYHPREPETYIRNRLDKTNSGPISFEILLITWNEGAKTPLHGHPKIGCWMIVLEGEFIETLANGSTKPLKKGDIGIQRGSNGLHTIQCIKIDSISGSGKTLHIYSPPYVS